MTAAARHDAILRELELRGSLSVARFAEHVGVTAMTVRRDLAALEQRRLLVRVHGGAVSLDVASHQDPAGRAASGRRPLATIGMISPSASYYFPQVIRGAGHAARALNCRLVLGVTNYSEREELRQAERLIKGGGIDAVMITPSVALAEGSPLHSLLVEATLPIVLVERSEDEGGRLDSVRSDHAYGATLAVEHLAGLGHQRIAAAVRKAPTAAGIIAGYDRTLDRLGLADARLHWTLPSPESGDDATTEALERFLDECLRLGVSAALILGDVDAVALTDIAQHRGVRVPEDLAIVAYDDEVARYAVVPLTAVAPAKHELGYAAVKLCVDRLRRDEGDAHAVTRLALMPKLIERESTRVR